jgi:nucleoid-associated protein YgaU
MKISFLLISLLILSSCSGSKSAQKVDENSPDVELSNTDEEIGTDESASVENEGESALDTEENQVTSNDEEIQINDETSENQEIGDPEAYQPGEQKQYVVQKNETLMLIAFKLYGDYGKWKNLVNQNPGLVREGNIVKAGTVLNYQAPASEFVWSPTGNPYLIKNGDTLGTISKDVYQTVSKWKLLWENNRPMIKDPNKIFAGFTLYYVDGREVASDI